MGPRLDPLPSGSQGAAVSKPAAAPTHRWARKGQQHRPIPDRGVSRPGLNKEKRAHHETIDQTSDPRHGHRLHRPGLRDHRRRVRRDRRQWRLGLGRLPRERHPHRLRGQGQSQDGPPWPRG